MSGARFEPLRSLARNAQRRHMEMQCDPSWVLDVFDERDTLRAEVERLRQALDRINLRTKAYADDCRGMPEYSTLVVAEIARKALGATK